LDLFECQGHVAKAGRLTTNIIATMTVALIQEADETIDPLNLRIEFLIALSLAIDSQNAAQDHDTDSFAAVLLAQ